MFIHLLGLFGVVENMILHRRTQREEREREERLGLLRGAIQGLG
jgi:hypothetical protein